MSWLCEYSKIGYEGKCPNSNCQANIGDRHESGCLFCLFHKGITKSGLEIIYGKEEVSKQEDRLKNAAALFYTIQTLQKSELVCPNCGREGGLCEDIESCDDRKFFSEALVLEYPFKHLGVRREDIWNLVKRRKEIRRKGIDFKEMMHLKKCVFDKLLTLYYKGEENEGR